MWCKFVQCIVPSVSMMYHSLFMLCTRPGECEECYCDNVCVYEVFWGQLYLHVL